jgi:hypothetical protein
MLLYRAVCQAELARTIRKQKFSPAPNSLESKWLADRPQDAAEWGRRFGAMAGIKNGFI